MHVNPYCLLSEVPTILPHSELRRFQISGQANADSSSAPRLNQLSAKILNGQVCRNKVMLSMLIPKT